MCAVRYQGMSNPHSPHAPDDRDVPSDGRDVPSDGLERADVEAAKSAARHRHHPVVSTLGILSDVADQIPLGIVCASVMAGGLVADRPDVLRLGTRMMAAHVLANLVKRRIKNRVRRTRPEEIVGNRSYRFEAGETQGGHDTSFPSGHTAGAVAVAAILSRDKPDLALPALGMAALIAGVQIPRAKHYPIDVLAGIALGFASARVVDRVLPGTEYHHTSQRTIMSDQATRSVSASFDTREAADRAIEHLVQQHGIDRADVFAEAEGAENTVGTKPSGGDADKDGAMTDAPLAGTIKVSVDVPERHAQTVQENLGDMGGRNIAMR